MTNHAHSTFVIDSWNAEPFDEAEGASLSRTRLTKTFQGDIQGTSTAETLMATAANGSMAYVGFERFNVSILGRAGTFVLHHNATSSASGGSTSWTVLLESGTGALRGLHGEGTITQEPGGGHTFTLDYEIEPGST